nr:type IV secretory system conjugative DNA transfer family protein [uncultured Anaerostipes sp.]
MKALYKDSAGTLLANCDTLLFLGGTDPEVKKFISESLGKQTIWKKSSSVTRGKSGSSSQSEDRIGRELMTPDEVGRMDNKECIVMIRGEYPIKGKKLDATKHKRAQQSGLFGKPYFHRKSQSIQWKDVSEILAKTQFKKTYMDVIVKAVEAEIPEKIVKSYIWDAMNEEEKEQGDNKLRDLDGNGIKNDNVPQKGVQ